MAVQIQFFAIDGEANTFPVTKPIKRKALTAVYAQRADSGLWLQLWDSQYDVINNSIVVTEEFLNLEKVNNLEVRVADEPDELGLPPSYLNLIIKHLPEIISVANNIDDVTTVANDMLVLKIVAYGLPVINIAAQNINEIIAVAQNIANVNTVAGISSEINTVVLIENEIVTVASNMSIIEAVGQNITEVVAVGQNITDVVTTAQNITDVIAVATDMAYIEIVATDIANVNLVANSIANVDAVGTNINNVNIVASNIDAVIEAYTRAREAEAKAMSAESAASQPYGEYVRSYYYDSASDSILYNELNTFSSFHYALESRLHSAGITLLGLWDSVDCSYPPAPTPDVVPDGESANGYTYIVKSVSGDTSSCSDLSVGDWIVWFGDDPATDDVIEGQWYLLNWTFDWSAIINVPEHIQNAVSRLGDTMSGELTLPYMTVENTYPRIDFKETDSTDGNVVRITTNSDNFAVQRKLSNGDWERDFIKGSMLLADATPTLEWKNAQLHLQNGELLVNDNVTVDYGDGKTAIRMDGIEFDRGTSYIIPTTADTQSLRFGAFSEGSRDWKDIQFYTQRAYFSGDMDLKGSITIDNGSTFEQFKVNRASANGNHSFAAKLAVLSADDGKGYARLICQNNDSGDEIELRVHNDGQVEATDCASVTSNRALTTKEYVDGAVSAREFYGEIDGIDLNTVTNHGNYHFVNITQDLNNPSTDLNGFLNYAGDNVNGTQTVITSESIWSRDNNNGTWDEWNELGGGGSELPPHTHNTAEIFSSSDPATDLDTLLANKSDINHTHSGYALENDLIAHTGNTSNPHMVTAQQVGAPQGSWSFDETTNTLNITIP